jgi:hypothetical protein
MARAIPCFFDGVPMNHALQRCADTRFARRRERLNGQAGCPQIIQKGEMFALSVVMVWNSQDR